MENNDEMVTIYVMGKKHMVPDDLTRYQANQWGIDQMLTKAQSILNLTVLEGKAYVGTGAGMFYAIDLTP